MRSYKMEHKNKDFVVQFIETGNKVDFYGTMRLRDHTEYQLINDIIVKAAETVDGELQLDLRHLKYLNSAGINMFSKFIIMSRNANKISIKVLGNSNISWQSKSLKNLQRLWDKVVIVID